MQLELQHKHQRSQLQENPKDTSSNYNHQSRVVSHGQPSKSEVFQAPVILSHSYVPYNFGTEFLESILVDSQTNIPQNVLSKIKQEMNFHENRVYHGSLHFISEFVHLEMKDYKTSMQEILSETFENIHNQVEAGIWDGQFEIRKKNDQKLSKQQELIVNITNDLVKRNIDSFKDTLEEEKEILSLSPTNDRSAMSKTKKAQNFVRQINQKQQKYKQFLRKIQEQKRAVSIKSEYDYKQKQENQKVQKKQLLKKRLQKNKQFSILEKERRKKLHQDYLTMVSSSSKPLYKERQEKLRKILMKQQKDKLRMMKQNGHQKRSISSQEVKEHMQNYKILKEEYEGYRDEQFDLRLNQIQIRSEQEKRHFRSKYHSVVLKEKEKLDELSIRTSMVKKKTDYGDHVKKNFMPKTDERKQIEIKELMKKINAHKGEKYNSRKTLEQGNKNLEKLHMLIGQLRAKNKLKPNTDLEKLIQQSKPPKRRYKNYLEDIREENIVKRKEDENLFDQSFMTKQQPTFIVDKMKMEVAKKEDNARKRQKYLNYSLQTIDIHTHMTGKSKVEDDYIKSAQIKMALLNKFNKNQQD